MSGLPNDSGRQHRRFWRLYLGAAAFLGGVLLLGLGLVSVTRAALDPVTAAPLGWSVLLTGCVLPAVLLTATPGFGGRDWRLTALGIGAAYAGVVLFGLLVPADWSGAVTASMAAAGVVYAGGLFALLLGFVAATLDDGHEPRPGRTAVETGRRRPDGSVSADGGDDEDDLTFLTEDDR